MCCQNLISILVVGPFDQVFTYKSADKIKPGTIVEVPFGRRTVVGIVVDEEVSSEFELKNIEVVYDYTFLAEQIYFLNWVAKYTLIKRGMVLKMMLSELSVFKNNPKDVVLNNVGLSDVEINLNEEQQSAYNIICSDNVKPVLLHGVTGSGKTEVYLSYIRNIIMRKQQVLLLFPEIALSNQIIKRIQKYFNNLIVWNSSITSKNKRLFWKKIESGSPCIVIGTRSALFLPFKNLGAIVIDEEHDVSYKQQESGCYNARDMAVVLANILKCKIILSTATPSLESYINAKNQKYDYCVINSRYGAASMPKIFLVDMRQNKFRGYISPVLIGEIKKCLDRGEQSLIYLNRRGYSPITLCKSCGSKITCPNCTSCLVFHKWLNKLICHYCGHSIDMLYECKFCNEHDSYIQFGPGVERIYDELVELFPNSKVMIASSDTLSSEKKIEELFAKIHNNEVNIIIATQILSKGHHFPNITFIGIVDGDLGLHGADLRASEKMYQLINQVAGRAGREQKPGRIFIQTYSPEHPLYNAIVSNKLEDFINLEIETRKACDTPPFSRLVSVVISGTNKELTEKIAKLLANHKISGAKIFGPTQAVIFLLRGRVRWKILIKFSKNIDASKSVRYWLANFSCPRNIKIDIDIDPVTFL